MSFEEGLGLTTLVIVVGSLGVFPIIGLILQVYRDHRGQRRNLAKRCYACGSSGTLFPVSHYKGDTFLYCIPCAKRQQLASKRVGQVALLMALVGGMIWLVLTY